MFSGLLLSKGIYQPFKHVRTEKQKLELCICVAQINGAVANNFLSHGI
jgi:hypothetical protein